MIQKITAYQAFCDACGERNPSRRLFLNELILRNELDKNKWKVINGFLYCPDCYEYDKETNEYKLKKQRLNYGKD